MEIEIREAVRSDIHALKDKLREADREEILAAGNASSEAALTQSFEGSSLCFCVDIEGSPAALFGIVPESLVGERANVWFLGSGEMKKIRKTFVKLSRKFIDQFLDVYPCLWNLVDSRYHTSVRWLEFCGAQFGKTVKMNGVDFYSFEFRRKA